MNCIPTKRLHFLPFLLSLLFFNNSFAGSEITVNNTIHALVAPEGKHYTWYKGDSIIPGEKGETLHITESGTYHAEVTDGEGRLSRYSAKVMVALSGTIVKIYLIGDSTVMNYTPEQYPMTGWGQMLRHFFNSHVTVGNYAVAGVSSRTFYQRGFWSNLLKNIQPGNFVFIQFGHNDMDTAAARYTSASEYKRYLSLYVTETRAKGGIPLLVTPVVKNKWANDTLTNGFTDPGKDYRGALLQLADSLSVAYVDLNQKSWNLYKTMDPNYLRRMVYFMLLKGEYPNFPNGKADPTHFQPTGATEIASLVVEGLRESNDPDVQNFLVPNLAPTYLVSVNTDLPGADSMISRNLYYPAGIEVTMKVVPKKRFSLLSWNDQQSRCVTTDKRFTFNMGSSPVSFSTNYKGVTLLNTKGVKFSYYKNTTGTPWTRLPNFNLLGPSSSGYASGINLSSVPDMHQAGVVLDAFIYIPTSGTYTFYLKSSDGSKLFIDNLLVVNNDSIHPETEKSGDIALVKGYSRIRVMYFNAEHPARLTLSYSTTSAAKTVVPAHTFFSSVPGCKADSMILISERASTYLWNNGTTESYITVKTDGIRKLQTQRENGCTVLETIPVVFEKTRESPAVEVTPDFYTLCADSSLELTGASPAGGCWIGPGVYEKDGRSYFTSSAKRIYNKLLYSYTSMNGCHAQANRTIFTEVCDDPLGFEPGEVIPGAGVYLGACTPNPASHAATVTVKTEPFTEAVIEICTLTQGHCVQKIKLDQSGLQQVIFNLETLPSGMYTYSLVVNGRKMAARKLAVVK